MGKTCKKTLAIMLTVFMILTLMPASAFAEEFRKTVSLKFSSSDIAENSDVYYQIGDEEEVSLDWTKKDGGGAVWIHDIEDGTTIRIRVAEEFEITAYEGEDGTSPAYNATYVDGVYSFVADANRQVYRICVRSNDNENQPGENQPGENQPGENQPGENQPQLNMGDVRVYISESHCGVVSFATSADENAEWTVIDRTNENTNNNRTEVIIRANELPQGATQLYFRLSPNENCDLDDYRGNDGLTNNTYRTAETERGNLDFSKRNDGFVTAIPYTTNTTYEVELRFMEHSGNPGQPGDQPGPGGDEEGPDNTMFHRFYPDDYYDGGEQKTSTYTLTEASSDIDFVINDSHIEDNPLGARKGSYTYRYKGEGTVDFYFACFFSERFTSIRINDVDYSDFIPTDRDTLIRSFYAQKNHLTIEVPYAENYKIEAIKKDITEDEAELLVIGNFLWRTLDDPGFVIVTNEQNGTIDVKVNDGEYVKYDEINPETLQDGDTIYVKVSYRDDYDGEIFSPGGTVDTIDPANCYNIEFSQDESNNRTYYSSFKYHEDTMCVHVNLAGGSTMPDSITGGRIELSKAVYEGEVLFDEKDGTNKLEPYTAFNWDGDNANGDAEFPDGTELTVRLIPEPGKQLVQFGLNGFSSDAEEEISTYTFTVAKGNFHLNAVFDFVEDTVVLEKNDTIRGVVYDYDRSESIVDSGSLNLRVEAQETQEEDPGVVAKMSIDLENVFFAGSREIHDEWTSLVTDTNQKDIDITMYLEKDLDPDTGYVMIREHDEGNGNFSCDVLPVECDYEDNSITFASDKFSNYTLVEGSFESATLAGCSATLDGEIHLNYYMELSEDLLDRDDVFMEFTVNGETACVPVKEAEEKAMDGSVYKVFTCKVAAQDMTKEIASKFVIGEREIDLGTNSVKEYADSILNGSSDNPEYAKAVPVVKAMLNYGGFSQAYFAGTDGALANDDVYSDAENPVLTNPDSYYELDGYTFEAPVDDIGLTYYGSSLILESKTTVRMYMEVTDSSLATIQDVTNAYKFSIDGQAVTPVMKSVSGQKVIYVQVENIAAHQLTKTYTVKVDEIAGSGSLTFAYGPMNYIKGMYMSENTVVKNVVRALYIYCKEAERYATSQ